MLLRGSDLLITSMITGRMVMLPIKENYEKTRETNNHWLNVLMNKNITVEFFNGKCMEMNPTVYVYITARANDARCPKQVC